MKESSWFILLIILLSCSATASEPLISLVSGLDQAFLQTKQVFDLWVAEEQRWSLVFQAPDLVSFLTSEGESPKQIFQGSSAGSFSSFLEIAFAVKELALGSYVFPIDVALHGARGILGLPLGDKYWILPLKSDEVFVHKEEGNVVLVEGEWYCLQPHEQVFIGDQQVNFSFTAVQSLPTTTSLQPEMLYWTNPAIDAEAGDRVEVSLNLTRSHAGGELKITGSKGILFGQEWHLESFGPLPVVEQDNGVTLHLPPLETGTQRIVGAIYSPLLPETRDLQVEALFAKHRAVLTLTPTRDWFDRSVQHISFKGLEQKPVLMPTGTIQLSDNQGSVTFKRRGIEAIIPLTEPEKPLWTSVPFAWTMVEPFESEVNEVSQLFLPILTWDEGFAWRLVAKRAPWFADVNQERQIVTGEIGNVNLAYSNGKLTLENTLLRTWHSQGFSLQEDGEKRQLGWEQNGWTASLEIPRGEAKKPELRLGFKGKNWRWQAKRNDLAFSFSPSTAAVGARLSNKSAWLSLQKPNVRFEVRPNLLQITYKVAQDSSLQFKLRKEEWKLHLLGKHLEIDISNLFRDSQQVRLKAAATNSFDRWHFATEGAALIRKDIIIAELRQRLGFAVHPSYRPYLEGALFLNKLRGASSKLNTLFGAGLVYLPTPRIITEWGWNTHKGLFFKAGLAIPLTKKGGD